MLLRIEPIEKALESLDDRGYVILLSPSGTLFSQKKAEELAVKDKMKGTMNAGLAMLKKL